MAVKVSPTCGIPVISRVPVNGIIETLTSLLVNIP